MPCRRRLEVASLPVERIVVFVECFLPLVKANLPVRCDAFPRVNGLCLLVQASLQLAQLALMRIKRLASELN